MWKVITREQNQKIILIYLIIAGIFALIGIYTKQSFSYVVSFVLIGLVFIRRYWLKQRLKN
jgi:hypothetical membrane protein